MPNFEKDDKVVSSKSSAASKGTSSTSTAAKTSSASKASSAPKAAASVAKASSSVSTASRTGEKAPPPSLVSSSGAATRGDSVLGKAARPVANATGLAAYDPPSRSVERGTESLLSGAGGSPTRKGGGLDFAVQTADRSGQNYRERYGVAEPGAVPGSFEDWVDTATRGTIGAVAGGLNSLAPPLVGLGMGVLEAAEGIDPGRDPARDEDDPRSSSLQQLMGGYGFGAELTEQALAPYIAMDPRLARNAGVIADVASVASPLLGTGGKLAGGLDAVQTATKLPKGANIVADNLLRDIALKRTPDELQRILRARDMVSARAAADEALDAPISDLLAQRASADIRELRTNAFEQSGRPTIAATDEWLDRRYGGDIPDYMGADEAAEILQDSIDPIPKEDMMGPLARAGVVTGGMGATGVALALWDAQQKAAQKVADEAERARLSTDPVGRGARFEDLKAFMRGSDTLVPKFEEGMLGRGLPAERLLAEPPVDVPIDVPVDAPLRQEDALDLPNQQEGWDVDPGNVVDSSPGELFEDNDRPLNIYGPPANPAIVAPGPGAWTVPEGTVLAPNGYYYSKAADGSWKREGRVEGYSPSQLYRAANKGAFEDPSNVTARSTPVPAARPAGQETLFDKLIGFGGTALENTALGGIAKGLFPDMWFGAGEAIKSLDNGTFSVPDEQDPDWWRSLASEVRPTAAPATTPPPDDDDDDDDDGGTGTGGTAPIYDRNGMVVFPDLPPYNPGRDDEWLYFRKRLANGGLVNGYAAGGEVEYSPRDPLPATAGLDPRLGLIADAEDALAGELPDPEPVLTAFVQQFGAAALDRLREQVSKGLRMRGDNARLVRGPGGPKDDAIPARINGVQEARLSDGEFVMTADAVRNAGDGDPRVGADRLMELNEMLAKGKRTDEPAPVEIVG